MQMKFLRALILLLMWPSLLLAQSIDDVLSPGELVAGHAKWDSECTKCHERFNKSAQRRLCLDCHKDIAADLQRHDRYHGRLTESQCRSCHTEHKGRKAKISKVDANQFDHSKTNFPLKGAHEKAGKKCASCHVAGKKYREAPKRCNECHKKHDVHKGALGEKCETCHNEKLWKETTFDHAKTRFKLEDKHADRKCKECHQDRRYKDTPRDCYSCHHKADEKDGHEGQFGKKCEDCHNAKAWDPSTFDHDKTHFQLKGKHDDAQCMSCHTGILFVQKLPLKCVACHRKDDNEKGHKGSLGEKCESCHEETGWKTTRFNHDTDTKYPLTGKHVKTKCEGCHKGGVAASAGKPAEQLSTECIACHRKNDDDKGHKGKFGEKCDTCHWTDEWKKTKFDHDRDAKYPLLGKHAETKCATCHTGALYKDKTPKECYGCHKKHDEEKGHKGKLGTRCGDCHSSANWKIENFDHNRSRFPLTGNHTVVECKKCHTSLAYREAPRKCYACHEKADVHKQRLGLECEHCHGTRNWKIWDFDHNKTKFRLDGAHLTIDCYSCHKSAVPVGRCAAVPSSAKSETTAVPD